MTLTNKKHQEDNKMTIQKAIALLCRAQIEIAELEEDYWDDFAKTEGRRVKVKNRVALEIEKVLEQYTKDQKTLADWKAEEECGCRNKEKENG